MGKSKRRASGLLVRRGDWDQPVQMLASKLSSAERGHGRIASGGGHTANWVCSLINSKAGELRGCPVALHINDLSAF